MLFISIARMHHIRSLAKLRRLKQYAVSANVSGLVKAGKPGVLVFEGTKYSIKTFLDNARSLRYLEFHHVDTILLDTILLDTSLHITNAKAGLHEVKDMNTLVLAVDSLGLKAWFRSQIGMDKG
ncbi:hypothetical protein AX15_005825 [Amanita polypyramis BW_CC]|nr:hypothetical protein AX15_005825 [Amanita polypyramis BW_CC]